MAQLVMSRLAKAVLTAPDLRDVTKLFTRVDRQVSSRQGTMISFEISLMVAQVAVFSGRIVDTTPTKC
jgi:hypothetical protein